MLTFQQRSQLREGCVRHVVKPTLNKDTVVRLQLEVLCNIVHDDCLGQVSADPAQVLNEYWTVGQSVLSVESVGNAFVLVDLV